MLSRAGHSVSPRLQSTEKKLLDNELFDEEVKFLLFVYSCGFFFFLLIKGNSMFRIK